MHIVSCPKCGNAGALTLCENSVTCEHCHQRVQLSEPVKAFLKTAGVLWGDVEITLRGARARAAIREHTEYLEDQGYADIILGHLDENLTGTEDVGTGAVWDPGEMEAD
jgi:hypothetical protein